MCAKFAKLLAVLILTLAMTLAGCSTLEVKEDVDPPIWVPKLLITHLVPQPPGRQIRFEHSPDHIHMSPEDFHDWVNYMWALQDWIDKARGDPGRPWWLLKIESDAPPSMSEPMGVLRKSF